MKKVLIASVFALAGAAYAAPPTNTIEWCQLESEMAVAVQTRRGILRYSLQRITEGINADLDRAMTANRLRDDQRDEAIAAYHHAIKSAYVLTPSANATEVGDFAAQMCLARSR